MLQTVRRLKRDASGATSIEYGLIISLVILAMFAALSTFAGKAVQQMNNVAAEVSKY
jgi:Flp pilus assembly pilin Flp